MGGDESIEQKPEIPKIRSSGSYFGQNDIINIDSGNIEETIRDLQLERVYKRNPNLRPGNSPPKQTYQLKSFLSISEPPPYLKVFQSFSTISFGLKSEVPGRITLITKSNEISSLEFEESERASISIPLPIKESFLLDLTPDLSKLSKPISKSFLPVTKHELRFEFVDAEDGTQKLAYVDKRLQTNQNSFTVKVSKNVPIFEEQLTGNCLICNSNVADTSIGNCGHNVICKKCLMERHVRLHHCPLCGAPTVI